MEKQHHTKDDNNTQIRLQRYKIFLTLTIEEYPHTKGSISRDIDPFVLTALY